MVFHDDDLERLTGIKEPVGSRRRATGHDGAARQRAGDTPQRLTAFLKQIAGRTLLQIELTAADAEMRETLAREAPARSPPIAAGDGRELRSELLIAIRRHGYKGPLGIITYDYAQKDWDTDLTDGQRTILRHLLHWPRTRFSFISCLHRSLQLPAVRLFRALGMPVTAWTVRTPEERQLAAAGADQIVFEGFDPDSA